MLIAVSLSPSGSLYDLQKPRYKITLLAPRRKNGRGPPEHLVRIHIVYHHDYGSETPQLQP